MNPPHPTASINREAGAAGIEKAAGSYGAIGFWLAAQVVTGVPIDISVIQNFGALLVKDPEPVLINAAFTVHDESSSVG